jgi:large subunit ribosomal protein L9
VKIILLEKIHQVGQIGDQVEVKNGYARNFLFPKGLAVMATPANVATFDTRREELERQSNDRLVAAEARAKTLEKLEKVTLVVRASDEGRLYGSIGVRDITEAVVEKGFDLKKREVLMPDGPIRMVGEHKVNFQLHSDVVMEMQVVVEAEKMAVE